MTKPRSTSDAIAGSLARQVLSSACTLVPRECAAAGSSYRLAPGRFTNIDATSVIVAGGLPSGAHSDILHPEVAWLVVTAAGLG